MTARDVEAGRRDVPAIRAAARCSTASIWRSAPASRVGAARPQRHGQDHPAARGHGPRAARAAGQRLVRWRGDHRAGRRSPSATPASPTCRKAGRSSPTSRSRRTCCSACSARRDLARRVPDAIYARFPILAERRAPDGPARCRAASSSSSRSRAPSSAGRACFCSTSPPKASSLPSCTVHRRSSVEAIAREEGMALLLVEQNIDLVLALTTRVPVHRERPHRRRSARTARAARRQRTARALPLGLKHRWPRSSSSRSTRPTSCSRCCW